MNHGIKRPFHLVCAVLLLIVCIPLSSLFAAPEITFEKKTFDFGEIIAGDSAVCFFTFTNTGDSTLKILDMRTTCLCALADLEKKTYEPKEKGTIKAIFYSTGRKGKVTKSVFITTNIKENRVVRLAITGHIKKTWKCEPEKVDFGEIGDRTILIDTVEISTESVDSIRIDSIIPEPEELNVSIVKHEGSSVHLKVLVEASGIKWRFIGVIRFFSNIPEARKIIIPVYARMSEEDAGK
jgi:hypothetical protein